MKALVVGFAVTGQAAAAALLRRGATVVAVDDRGGPDLVRAAADLGVELVEAPSVDRLAALGAGVDVVVVSPGVPAGHPLFGLDLDAPVISEIELAAGWLEVPIVAVTGTNGKTTVATLVTAMLEESGRRAVAAGNIGLTLAEAADMDADVFVVEVSSFQLALTRSFRPEVAVWLNLAEDHLDWHPDMAHYARSKARIWANQRGEDVAVVNAEDPVVLDMATTGPHRAPAGLVTFGLSRGDYRLRGDDLVGPDGGVVATTGDMWRALPHDVANALAAAAAARAMGAPPEAVAAGLRRYTGLPHRVSLVAEVDGVGWYDDSKATTPASVVAALGGFDSVVLVAGGRNKGLDLSPLGRQVDRVRAVVAIGESAGEVEAVFAGRRPVRTAGSMEEAVEAAASFARPGDAVLLSPGCASFDWYRSYGERGDDFASAVRNLAERRDP
ncbi:MAG TPA: UDP-N-acetylmuramoyl-L-alanine--D-glutamate ligase [Acidimicrobiales bacterium]|nr:UDP-N-acetylmuramoyl-L-alanine--D-glutamate ligase [Acidimicrobiales bacterium]